MAPPRASRLAPQAARRAPRAEIHPTESKTSPTREPRRALWCYTRPSLMKSASAKNCPSCGERYDADVLFCPRDGTPLSNGRTPSLAGAERDPYLGVELPGQIKLKHLIGIGSMGRVYRAFQGGIDRD